MTRRFAWIVAAYLATIVAICVWQWHVLGVCHEWTHQHETSSWVGWLLASCFGVMAVGVWQTARR